MGAGANKPTALGCPGSNRARVCIAPDLSRLVLRPWHTQASGIGFPALGGEAALYRQQLHMQIGLGKYRDFYDTVVALNDELKRKGLKQIELWAPATGAEMNTVVLVTDFESLAQWEEDNRKFQTDPEVMKIWRSGAAFVDGRPREELWQTAYEIA